MADRQRARVYAWEDRVVGPQDPSLVSFPAAQGMVDAIWSEMGLLYPPRVERLPSQARCRQADANRLAIKLPPSTPSWCLLHELAHTMTTTLDGHSDGHGPALMGLYAQLLVRYLRLNSAGLFEGLVQAGVKVQANAEPVFCDVGGRPFHAAETPGVQGKRKPKVAP